MAFENSNRDLILGDPNGAHIELLGNEAKIVLYNEFGTAIMEYDGSTEFFGETFSRILIKNKEGVPRLQLDQFQVALSGNTEADIRLVAGGLPEQNPRVEFLTQPITSHFPARGEIRAEKIDAPEYGAKLVILSPTFDAHVAAQLTLESEHTSAANPLATLDADLLVNGGTILNGTAVNGATVLQSTVTANGAITANGTLTANGDATFGGAVTLTDYSTQWVVDTTAIASFTNTSGAVGSPICGFAFVAPPSGKVMVTVGGVIRSANNTVAAVLSFQLRTGTTLNAGTDVVPIDYRNGIQTGKAVNTGATADEAASRRIPVSGLTPGASYNVVTKHWITAAGGGSLDQREIIVEPIL